MNEVRVPFRLMLLIGLHCSLYILQPFFSLKTIDLLGVQFLSGALVSTMSNSTTDVINQVYGIKTARTAILCSLWVRIVSWAMIVGIVALPAAREVPGFAKFMSVGFGVFIGGQISHLLGQWYLDTKVFNWMRTKFSIPALSFNASNLVSATIATTIIILSKATTTGVVEWHAIWGGVLMKMVMSVVLTPVFLLLVRWAAAEPVEA